MLELWNSPPKSVKKRVITTTPPGRRSKPLKTLGLLKVVF